MTQKKAVVFELDDVLFPKKDYLLQVYYLFANLLEYTETVPPANDLTDFMKIAYEQHGEWGIFERAAEVFCIDRKYKAQFDGLHRTALLPLKLLLYKPMLELMQTLHQEGKQLLVLTEGDPAVQLNKLRHVEWNGLDQFIKVYFADELQQQTKPLTFLLETNRLEAADMLCVHAAGTRAPSGTLPIDCVSADRFWPL
ncbi:haloacid dehalogenase [Parapedobacter deserti]|uniref:Haloacid dehalogenase n=1 Tax=Parapedobacter deserti TaxID=1912957 RepID=A0ABV7JHR5_9SPHI